jgi:glycosyltransferase involved in cell wall biosynthesis
MNIWYISKYASPSKYFFGTRHFYLAEEWINTGNDVTVITSNSSHLTESLPKFNESVFIEFINGVRTVWLNTFESKKSSGIFRILSWFHFDFKLLLFKKRDLPPPEVIIVSSLSLTTVLPAWILACRYKAKFIFEVRDIWPLSILVLGGYSKYNPFIIYLNWLEKFGYKKADLIVGTMPNLIQHVREDCKITSKCISIPQGVSMRFYEQEQVVINDDYLDTFVPKNKFIICYAGTINKNNPLDNLINAAKILASNENIHFIVLGNGDRKEYFQKITIGYENVSFPPSIPKNQMNSFLQNIDVCYDSFDSELAQFGLSRNKWIDYMYASKPIICSYDGFQSMINEANCGTFVKFNDIEKLVEVVLMYSKLDQSELAMIGERGRKYLNDNRRFDYLAAKYIYEINNCNRN